MTDKVLRHSCSHHVPYDFSIEEIFTAGEVQPAFVGGDIDSISYPDVIGCFRYKVLFQKILGNRQRMFGVPRRLELFLLLAAKAVFFTDTLDPVHSDLDSMFGESCLYSFRTVGFPVSLVSRFYFDDQPYPFLLPWQVRAFQPSIVPLGKTSRVRQNNGTACSDRRSFITAYRAATPWQRTLLSSNVTELPCLECSHHVLKGGFRQRKLAGYLVDRNTAFDNQFFGLIPKFLQIKAVGASAHFGNSVTWGI